jgi:hypothetical protein
MLVNLTITASKIDALVLIDQLLDFDFLDIAYGILLNAHTSSKNLILRILDNLTLDSDKVWLKIHTDKYLFNTIVDFTASNDLKLRLEVLLYIVNFIIMANPQLLLVKLTEDQAVLNHLF